MYGSMHPQRQTIGKYNFSRAQQLTNCRLLYDMHSPRTSEGRGIVFGRIFASDGTLVATSSQEGVVRLTPKGQKAFKSKL